jgi:hypothetical protein
MIVTAGGLGTRIPSHVPKQFIELGQQPLLAHTLYQCYQALPFDEILLTLPADYRSYWEELYKAVSPKVPHRIVDGGQERFDSVKAALSTLEAGDGLVGIHDGVRPWIPCGSRPMISGCLWIVAWYEKFRRLRFLTCRISGRPMSRLVISPQPMMRRSGRKLAIA